MAGVEEGSGGGEEDGMVHGPHRVGAQAEQQILWCARIRSGRGGNLAPNIGGERVRAVGQLRAILNAGHSELGTGDSQARSETTHSWQKELQMLPR